MQRPITANDYLQMRWRETDVAKQTYEEELVRIKKAYDLELKRIETNLSPKVQPFIDRFYTNWNKFLRDHPTFDRGSEILDRLVILIRTYSEKLRPKDKKSSQQAARLRAKQRIALQIPPLGRGASLSKIAYFRNDIIFLLSGNPVTIGKRKLRRMSLDQSCTYLAGWLIQLGLETRTVPRRNVKGHLLSEDARFEKQVAELAHILEETYRAWHPQELPGQKRGIAFSSRPRNLCRKIVSKKSA